MAFKDIREFVKRLDKTGDVVHIKKEVDWELELGAIMRRAAETGGPACFFEKIKDYPASYRVLGNLGNWRRVAIAFGLAPETPTKEIQAEYERRMEKPIKPVVVKGGPCKENILVGDDIDLFRFPAPLEHEGDGHRSIGSWHVVASKDPDSDWTNWGMYRLLAYNRRYLGGHWHHANDCGKILHDKFIPKGKPMPIAAAIGVDPMCTLAAIAPMPVGVSEVDYAGGLRGEPVELVKCETSDLLVPANAEIVIEGEILPDVMVPTGPFGDYTGHEVKAAPLPVCRVKAITYRNNPILTVTHLGLPPDESNFWGLLCYTNGVKRVLKENGVPFIDVCVPIGSSENLVIISVKNPGSTVVDQISSILDSAGPDFPMFSIVVDENVDVYNSMEVFHAFTAKLHPARNIKIHSGRLVSALFNFLSPEDRKVATGMVAKGASVSFDCTTPREWSRETDVLPRVGFRDMLPELKNKVLANWKSYGFK